MADNHPQTEDSDRQRPQETTESPPGIQRCLQHGYREHVVGQSPSGWDIIDVVCPDCGIRLLPREVVQNPDGERRENLNLVPDGGRVVEQDTAELEESVKHDVREWVRNQRPDKETQKELLTEHQHHLVRDTESTYSRSPDSPDGIKVETTAYVYDTYCFTCGEWVGISGIELRGTLRSRANAYYLGGPPDDVRQARAKIRDELQSLAEYALLNVDHVEDVEEAFAFVGEQHEKLTKEASEVANGGA
jgi:hypothetical protein